ncbi:LysE family translocator [Paludibacterium denitrificans]|uniref:LysE family translocator n=1 Tax=Paludibacterium denitrificans TaxID=2675226 RepID=UPI002477EB0A|nr:LysE family transporter [Paludibacterium denitrificans]
MVMALSLIAAFWVVSTLCALTPGIDWAYVIAAGMNGRVVLPAVSGILLGQLTVALIVAGCVGALVASHPITLTMISLTGAAYLLWMGYGLLRQLKRQLGRRHFRHPIHQ